MADWDYIIRKIFRIPDFDRDYEEFWSLPGDERKARCIAAGPHAKEDADARRI